ncbi:MAG TPA: glycosyltransferase family 2 protein [Candidatus Dormibacteraeota bacterium]|nr:glycosyltransferase family 2 protein [Candidatus Dormibacteraeota bacterium]
MSGGGLRWRRRRLAHTAAVAGLLTAAVGLAVLPCVVPARASGTPGGLPALPGVSALPGLPTQPGAPALPALPTPLPSLPDAPGGVPPVPSIPAVPNVPVLPSGTPSPGSTACPTPVINPVSADPAGSGVQTVAAAGAPVPQGPQAGPAGTWVTVNGTNLVAPGCWTFVYIGAAQQSLPAPTTAGAIAPQPTATSVTVAAGGSAGAPESGQVRVVLSPGGPPGGGVAQPAAGLPGLTPAPGSVSSNGTLTFVEPPSISTQALQSAERTPLSLSGTGFQLGGLVTASAPTMAYHAGADPATAPVCDSVPADPVAADTALRAYAPATFCSGAMVLELRAPRDTGQPSAGESTVWSVAGTMDVLPVVDGIDPQQASPDQVVVVSGSGLGRGAGAGASIGGAVAGIAAWQDHAVALVVPRDAAGGTVTLVRGEDGRSIAAGSFTLVPAGTPGGGGAGSGGAGAGGAGGAHDGIDGLGTGTGVAGAPGGTLSTGRVIEQPLPGRLAQVVAPVVGSASPPAAPPSQVKPVAAPPLLFPRLGPLSLPSVLHSPWFGIVGVAVALAALALASRRRRVGATVVEAGAVERRSPFSGPVWQLIAGVARRAGAELGRQQSLRAGWAWAKPRVLKAVSVVSATLMVNVYVIAAVSTLTAVAVALGFGASAPGSEGTLYLIAGIFVSFALTAIAVRYIYYYRCWAVSRHWFRKPEPVDVEALRAREVPFLKVQVTTKGGALPVVERSLDELRSILERQEWLQPLLSVEVITEVEEEARSLEARFAGSVLEVTGITLPAGYHTPKGTRLKARALHHMCELRNDGFNRKPGRTFVVHFDEETLVDEANLLVLVDYLSRDPKPISQGPILYPLEWQKTPWICRALESTRPFGCSECARVMENPPPPHLHGSNLVIDEAVENRLGWDFGTVDGQPYVAEDLLFGLRAFAVLGDGAFGWHGATMLEQPPFSLYWAVQQRLRWVLGALQGLRAMSTDEDYASVPAEHKRRLFMAISFRIATYALGFPVGFAGLYFVLHPAQVATEWQTAFGLWHALIILSGVSWFLSYQIGIARNLRYQQVSGWRRAQHIVAMLLLTPVAGLCETVGPFLAVIRWMFGLRRASWTPTPKLDQPRLRPGTPA